MQSTISGSNPTQDEQSDRIPKASAWAVFALLMLAATGLVRLYWTARPGSEELAGSIHTLVGATAGTIWDLRTPAESYPDAQLHFWRSEIERILEEHPGDPGLHAAAAVVLTEPSSLYVSDLAESVARQDPRGLPAELGAQLEQTRRRFDAEGATLASQVIRRSTELAPDDPRWWRLRAMLLWPPPMSSETNAPHVPDWQEVLDAAEQHDPENGLYALLQAQWLSTQALEFDNQGALRIGNQAALHQALEHARDCAAAPQLTFGEPAMDGVVRLHALSHHPTATTTDSIRARFVASRLAYTSALLVRNLWRLSEMNGVRKDYGERARLLDLAQQVNELARQRSDKATRYDNLTVFLHKRLWEIRAELEREQGGVSAATKAGLQSAAHWEAAIQQATTKFQRPRRGTAGTAAAAISTIALSLFAACLAAAFCMAAIWLALSRSRSLLRLKWWPFVLFAASSGLSILFLGAGPAGLVSERAQHWMLTGLSLAVLISLLSTAAIRSPLRLRYSIRSLLIACTVVAVLLQMAFHFQLGWAELGLPLRIHAASDPLLSFVQHELPGGLGQLLFAPEWASRLILQWLIHDGPAWSVVILVALALVCSLWFSSMRAAVGQLAVATVVLSLLWLSVWIWIEPTTYASARPAQMRYESYIRSIDEYYVPFEKRLAEELRMTEQSA